MEASKTTPSNAHENGDVESAHRHFKRAVDQRLRLRGTRDFASLEQYELFLHQVVAARNAERQERLTEERAVMRSLPVRALPAWREEFATVTRWSTVRVARKAYSVPSRLIGERLRAHVFAAHIELWRGADRVGAYRRLRGGEPYHIDYRHLIQCRLRRWNLRIYNRSTPTHSSFPTRCG